MRSKITIILAALVTSAVLLGAGSASAHEWLKNGSPLTQPERIEIRTVGNFEIYTLPQQVTIECSKMVSEGTVYPGVGGNSEVNLELEGCKTNKPKCQVHSRNLPNGNIFMEDIPGDLVVTKEEPRPYNKVLADEFKENPIKEQFGALEFVLEPGGTCPYAPYLYATMHGHMGGEISGQELLFAKQEGNSFSETIGGNDFTEWWSEGQNRPEAVWVGAFKLSLNSGGTLSAN